MASEPEPSVPVDAEDKEKDTVDMNAASATESDEKFENKIEESAEFATDAWNEMDIPAQNENENEEDDENKPHPAESTEIVGGGTPKETERESATANIGSAETKDEATVEEVDIDMEKVQTTIDATNNGTVTEAVKGDTSKAVEDEPKLEDSISDTNAEVVNERVSKPIEEDASASKPDDDVNESFTKTLNNELNTVLEKVKHGHEHDTDGDEAEALDSVSEKKQQQQKKSASPCMNFALDMKADFGVCVCGHKRVAHEPEAFAQQKPGIPIAASHGEFKTNVSKIDCETYVVDMNAEKFGTCKCGQPKNLHSEQALENRTSSKSKHFQAKFEQKQSNPPPIPNRPIKQTEKFTSARHMYLQQKSSNTGDSSFWSSGRKLDEKQIEGSTENDKEKAFARQPSSGFDIPASGRAVVNPMLMSELNNKLGIKLKQEPIQFSSQENKRERNEIEPEGVPTVDSAERDVGNVANDAPTNSADIPVEGTDIQDDSNEQNTGGDKLPGEGPGDMVDEKLSSEEPVEELNDDANKQEKDSADTPKAEPESRIETSQEPIEKVEEVKEPAPESPPPLPPKPSREREPNKENPEEAGSGESEDDSEMQDFGKEPESIPAVEEAAQAKPETPEPEMNDYHANMDEDTNDKEPELAQKVNYEPKGAAEPECEPPKIPPNEEPPAANVKKLSLWQRLLRALTCGASQAKAMESAQKSGTHL
uniref:Uncharacterized protein n=1 Tax=Aplanochytrium stocchinoi TaxID=215587 RepID=A0A7S3V2D8_9STRA|mmetsp:Transcript_15057/g.17687  ORF Transcript_15057/g.17687 Transcript_15057/m.17687 type:complete len:709 (+) Transcript_15057:538-2664(+)